MPPSVEELLTLDTLTLRDHTEQAGDVFELDDQRTRLHTSLAVSDLCWVRREGQLVAYAMLQRETAACWFVGAFAMHPSHRSFAVMTELLAKVASLANDRGMAELRSHVYKTNQLSLAFHRKLGFRVTRENDKAVEFFAAIRELAMRPAIRRAAGTNISTPK